MWTNVFKIGGLQLVSWFQFLPSDADPNSIQEKSLRADQKDAATLLVLSSHLQLQNEGFLSTWTNCFVGPWDPSQGTHNPDEKIKLWLFLPGRHSSVVENAQGAISKLRVITAGQWIAPGGSEEVAVALSQALRNRIERALLRHSFMRFGDVFMRCQSPLQSEKYFRRVQHTCEFIFTASEEAIFVHVIVSAKHIRTLSSDDVERVLKQQSSNKIRENISVIVAPHGMRGRLTGCCPSDLVKQVYFSKHVEASSGLAVLGIPFQPAQSPSCQLRGQNCYVEVTLGYPGVANGMAVQPNVNSNKNVSRHHAIEQTHVLAENSPVLERKFIFPAEAVLVPVIHRAFATSSLKRIWLQNWVGTSFFEAWPLLNFSDSSFLIRCSKLGNSGNIETLLIPWFECNGKRKRHSYNSSSNSNSSSISSSSSTSSESDNEVVVGASELEADADSVSCRQSGLSTNDQYDNDGHKLVSKRLRTSMAESFGQAGTIINAAMKEAYKSEYSVVEGNNSATAGGANDVVGSHWDWDDDDRGVGTDIQSLLSEFGDFGDFFEDEVLAFGEPPGTAESQALMFSVADCGDVSGSPCTAAIDVRDQMLLPALGFSSFDGFNQPPSAVTEDQCKAQESPKDARSSGACNGTSAPPTSAFDHLSKAEAMMSFAPEYTAIETPASELSSSIFRSPYLPKSRKVESSYSCSSSYVYCATPPSSPCLEVSDEKIDMSSKVKLSPTKSDAGSRLHTENLYTHVHSSKQPLDRRLVSKDNGKASCKGEALSSVSGINSSNVPIPIQMKKNETSCEAGQFLLSLKTVLATEVEFMMFQAFMCRVRHTLLSCSSLGPNAQKRSSGSIVRDQLPSEMCAMTDKISSKNEVKKESIPVRIAGDIDSGMLDGPLNAPVGVWRPVGVPKGTRSTNMPNFGDSPSLPPHNIFTEEGSITSGQRQPLQVLLDAMALLVQQSASFVDMSLDVDQGDGPFGWLALQEQQRRGFSCWPSMVHAGCGGLLASSHSLDIAGVELIDPLSADVHASSVIAMLQSDMKVALKSAFGSLDGPLSIIDWCKGRNQSGDAGFTSDGYSGESAVSEVRDSASTVTVAVGEPLSPIQSSIGKDGTRLDESCQRRSGQENNSLESDQQMPSSRLRQTLLVFPLPAILVGYQDDWLKTSANSLKFWEKAPLEPYALPKPMTYCVVCPDIDPLTSAATDFFHQLGTVYETCKLGTHLPQVIGNQMENSVGKLSSSGFALVDCPQSIKISSNNGSIMGSISDYLSALSKGWEVRSFLKSLSKVLKALKLGSNSTVYQKEATSGPFTVIYVVCPFFEPAAVLQTVVESCAALGSNLLSVDKERRALLHSQVERSLSCSASVDEALVSNVLSLSGFSIPKLVLQIIPVDILFRISRPAINELVILKEIAFTVYNKARRIPRASSNDLIQSSTISCRPQSVLMQMTSSIPGLWKDCGVPRMSGSSLTREGDLDVSMRPGAWDGSWQVSRTGALNCDPSRAGDYYTHDDTCFLFEPLFILAEPGSIEQAVAPIFGNAVSDSTSSRPASDDGSSAYMHGSVGGTDSSSGSLFDGTDTDNFGSHHQKIASLHCCYGWTEDWRWLISIWTDARGELLDSHVFPFGGISSRQDTKGLHYLFVQILQQGIQILCSSSDVNTVKPRDIVITRIGCFFELECQEWQKAIYSIGGNEVKKWPLQLRRSVPDGVPSSSNGNSLQQQEINLMQERTLPSSPNHSLYSPHSKSSSYMKGSLGQTNNRKQLLSGQPTMDSSRGLLQWVQSISLIGVAIDHTLQFVFPADTSSLGAQGGGASSYLEGFSPVKSLGSTPASYILVPSPSMRYLPSMPFQLPTCLTAESPPLAHLLHSEGSAIPISTGFVVSKAVPSVRRDPPPAGKDEWPSILSVSLVDYYGGGNSIIIGCKQGRTLNSEGRDYQLETHWILEGVAAELHALSWMTASPGYVERRTALPFHCDMLLRLRRLLHFADNEFSQQTENCTVV